MKKLLLALGATLAFSGLAFAGEAEGTVQNVDANAKTVTLEDGTIWQAGEGVDVSTLAAGDTIKVTYDDATKMITAVEKM